MADAFTCTCGTSVAAPADEELPVICPQCHEMFFVPSPERRGTPLTQSLAAKASAWGCLMPTGVLLLLIGTRGLLSGRTPRAAWIIGAAAVFLAGFTWLLRLNSRSWRHCFKLAAPVCVVIAAVSAYIWKEVRAQQELDDRFAAVLNDARSVASILPGDAAAEPVLSPKYLPVLLTERGALHSDSPHVEAEFFDALPPESRPLRSEDVHTIVTIDWCYEQIGVYVSQDAYKKPNTRIYAGGCTVTVIDRDSKKCVGGRHFVVRTQAPETRPSDTNTTWYGPQPLEGDIDAYIKTLKFAGTATR